MINEDSLQDAIQIRDLREKALKMMQVYESEEKVAFYVWLNKFEYITDIINVPRDKKVDLFCHMVDEDSLERMKKIYSDVDYLVLPYELIINNYIHYLLFEDELKIHRNRFEIRNQYDHEPIENYARNLWKIYYMCNYTNYEEERLRKQFVNGIREDEIRKYLNKFSDLTFDEMVEKAVDYAKGHLISYYLDRALTMLNVYKSDEEGVFHTWLNMFEFVAKIINVPNDKMIEFFNKMIDNSIHEGVRRDFYFVNFFEIPYEEIMTYYMHFILLDEAPMIQAYRYYIRDQYENEPLEIYADCLRNIYIKFSYTQPEEESFCMQFINGIRYKEVVSYLRKNPCLLFDKTLAMAIEFARNNVMAYYIDHALSMIITYHSQEDGFFYSWLNKFEYVADMIGVPYNKMIEFLILMIDDKLHNAVKQIFPHVNFSELSYEQIIDKYYDFFQFPMKNVKIKRLTCRYQYENESIIRYAASLQKLYYTCDYEIVEKIALRELFIQGIRNDDVKNHLRENPCITFDETTARAIEFEIGFPITYYVDRILLRIRIFREGNFHCWLNRFEFLANMIKVPDKNMIELFNKMIDIDVHKKVKDIFPFVDFSILSYEQMINCYLRNFAFPNEFYLHRTRFSFRIQFGEETIQEYAVNLRKLYNKCNYIDHLENKLCEQFINGLCNEELILYLQNIGNLTFNDTVEKAIKF